MNGALSAPVLTAASPYNVAMATASITLGGMQFATTDATLTAALALADCATSGWTSATSAACIGVHGFVVRGTTGLTSAGILGTSSVVFSFDGVLFLNSNWGSFNRFIFSIYPQRPL